MPDTLEKKVSILIPKNFKIGDYLVGKNAGGNISIGFIRKIYIYGEGTITAEIGGVKRTVKYDDAIILKSNGTYLLGKNLINKLNKIDRETEQKKEKSKKVPSFSVKVPHVDE